MGGKGNKAHSLTLHLESSHSFSVKLVYAHFPVKLKKPGVRFQSFLPTIRRIVFQEVVAPAKWLWRACWTLLVTSQKELVARNAWEHITARETNGVYLPPRSSFYQQAFLQPLLKVIWQFYHLVWLQSSTWASSQHTSYMHLPFK